MSSQKGRLEFSKRDVWVLLNQFKKNGKCVSSLPLPSRGPERSGSKGSPLRTFLHQRAAVARLSKSVLPTAAAQTPRSINVLKRTRRSIESTLAIKHPPKKKGSQKNHSGNPPRFNHQWQRFNDLDTVICPLSHCLIGILKAPSCVSAISK